MRSSEGPCPPEVETMITVELTRREDSCPVQWMDRLAVVALLECIDRFNADRVANSCCW